MTSPLSFVTSMSSTLLAAGRGVVVRASNPPEQLLELYDIENCPFCRLVRETLTELDLDVMIYPCPKGGTRFRPLAQQIGGQTQFPLLYDPNTDVTLYESAEIIAYLHGTYGQGRAPAHWKIKAVQTPGSLLASAVRPGKGLRANHDNDLPDQPFELYSFEGSPFARFVREKLCELELPFIVRQLGRTQRDDWYLPLLRKKSHKPYQPTQRNRQWLVENTGKVSTPYFIDPNRNVAMFESGDIVRYLEQHYR